MENGRHSKCSHINGILNSYSRITWWSMMVWIGRSIQSCKCYDSLWNTSTAHHHTYLRTCKGVDPWQFGIPLLWWKLINLKWESAAAESDAVMQLFHLLFIKFMCLFCKHTTKNKLLSIPWSSHDENSVKCTSSKLRSEFRNHLGISSFVVQEPSFYFVTGFAQ